MKRSSRNIFILLLAQFALFTCSYGQEIVSNGDFEKYNQMPDQQGQIDRATNWEEVVVSADYMNTGYHCWCSHVGDAYSGKGYAGFASYGSSNASEAIGQDISVHPLLSGVKYRIMLYSKKASDGGYTSDCGGIQLWGFEAKPPLHGSSIHPDKLPGAKLLWTSMDLTSVKWTKFTGYFKVDAQVNYIVFSMPPQDCGEYAFVDSISIRKDGPIDTETIFNDMNPSTPMIQLQDFELPLEMDNYFFRRKETCIVEFNA